MVLTNVDLSYRPRHNFIVLQLRLFIAAGDQNLRTWMIERHQQPIMPAANFARVMLQVELMIVKQLERIKRDCSQCHNNRGFDEFNRALQECRTVSDFGSLGPAIRS